MKIDSVDFSGLPFSHLYQDYVHQFGNLKTFFETDPFDMEAVKSRIKDFTYKGDRGRLVDILRTFNKDFDLEPQALANLDKLNDKGTVTIVTGQQLSVYGGVLYTVYKAITAILLAKKMSAETGNAVVPVFWLADEDHDYEEVSHVNLPEKDGVSHLQLEAGEDLKKAVAEITITSQIQTLREQIREMMPDTDFTEELWKNLDECFQPGVTFRIAFGRLISRIFSKHGMILAGSNDTAVKQFVKEGLVIAADKPDAIMSALEKSSSRVEKAYHRQAGTTASLLFLFSENRERLRLDYKEGSWTTDDGTIWSREDIKSIAMNEPERLSPNVFLRPILQDQLLPNIGYVAGPGEVAYYAQMKDLYSCFHQSMPVIFPRLSGTFIEPSIERVMVPMPFEFYEYSERIEDLEKAFVDKTNTFDVDAVFEEWKKDTEELANSKISEIAKIDPTLEGAAAKTTAAYHNELDKLKGKVIRQIKRENEIQIGRIHKIHLNLFPERSLQERTISFIYFMNKYGFDIFDQVIAEMSDAGFNTHKLISL